MTKRKTNFKGVPSNPHLLPQTPNQRELIRAICESEQVITVGPAGTGKTFVTASLAADMFNRKKIDKIIVTRPNVSAGRSIGFFPGTLEEKMSPWMIPVLEVLQRYIEKGALETAIKSRNIEMAPFETMRGRSFDDAFIILDEAQNSTPHEMKMFLTRIGKNCKAVVNGDIMQHDLRETSGLAKVIHMVKRYGLPVPVIEFTTDDIVRSDLVREWIIAFMKEEGNG